LCDLKVVLRIEAEQRQAPASREIGIWSLSREVIRIGLQQPSHTGKAELAEPVKFVIRVTQIPLNFSTELHTMFTSGVDRLVLILVDVARAGCRAGIVPE